MRTRQNTKPDYEAQLGPIIAHSIARNTREDEFEIDGVFFVIEVEKTWPDETETHSTGVSFMGDCETYCKTIHHARIKYLGAYELCRPPYWVKEPCADDTRDLDIPLDMCRLSICIEEQNDDYDEYRISIAA